MIEQHSQSATSIRTPRAQCYLRSGSRNISGGFFVYLRAWLLGTGNWVRVDSERQQKCASWIACNFLTWASSLRRKAGHSLSTSSQLGASFCSRVRLCTA